MVNTDVLKSWELRSNPFQGCEVDECCKLHKSLNTNG